VLIDQPLHLQGMEEFLLSFPKNAVKPAAREKNLTVKGRAFGSPLACGI
jgi:hypothetical protein